MAIDDHPDMPAPFAGWPRPLAFALSGAGAFGSVQVGMLRALLERGVRPDVIVGTSAGALHGALVAAQPEGRLDGLADLWRSLDRRAIFGGRASMAVHLLRHGTLSNGDRLRGLIAEQLPADSFDALHIRFAAVATDALTGEPELLSEGDLVTALLASSAVPGVFPSVDIDGRRYLDGGVAANVPIRQAIAFGANSVLSLDATPPTVASEAPRGLFSSVAHSASLMLRNQRSHAVEELAHRYRIAVLPSVTPPDMGSFNFAHTDMLLESSYELSVRTLDAWAAGSVRTDDR